ncbi:MAG: TetR/AcrR family transcriptional regulator [Planctomycetaceae bacterium]|nr:TetR/AcrR family transcriptional regulator [Planctomycetaceae bacterium]
MTKAHGEGGSTKEWIQEAAVELFSRKGYTRTTTAAIARRAGVNELTLFRIFGSKMALLHDVYFQLTPVADHVDVTGLTQGKKLEKDLAIFFRNYMVLHIKHMPAYRLSLQLQEEICNRELYYASFANIQGMIAQFVEYLTRLGDAGKIARLDYQALAEYMFSLFLVKAFEFSLGEAPGYDEKQVNRFVKAYARDMARALSI